MPFDTTLSPDDERKFQQWKSVNVNPQDSGEDYDFRGAFKAGIVMDPTSQHWPDTYKKPNHETFSDESIYSSLTGTRPGTWKNNETYVPFGGGMNAVPQATPDSTLQDLPGILARHGRMLALQQSNGDFDKVTNDALTTGAFGEALKRQQAWTNDIAQQQHKLVNAPLPGVPPKK